MPRYQEAEGKETGAKTEMASPKVLAIQTGFYIRLRRAEKHCEFYPFKRHKTPITVRMKSAEREGGLCDLRQGGKESKDCFTYQSVSGIILNNF